MTNTLLTEKYIQELLHQFEAGTLPKAAWTHEAHLVMAIAYNLLYGREVALAHARENITRFNESVGGANTDHGGYHETITRCWIWVADKFLQQQEDKSLAAACNAFIRSHYSDRKWLLHYYSSSVLFSVEARRSWVEPDIAPIEI